MSKRRKVAPVPSPGDEIYVPSQLHADKKGDDFIGGKAHVSRVYEDIKDGEPVNVVFVIQRPGHGYFWEDTIGREQKAYAKRYGDQMAKRDLDRYDFYLTLANEFRIPREEAKTRLLSYIYGIKRPGQTEAEFLEGAREFLKTSISLLPSFASQKGPDENKNASPT